MNDTTHFQGFAFAVNNFFLISDSVEVLGNMGRSVSLPCNTTSSSAKTVSLVMWFKGDAEDPIYSLDLRHVEVNL